MEFDEKTGFLMAVGSSAGKVRCYFLFVDKGCGICLHLV